MGQLNEQQCVPCQHSARGLQPLRSATSTQRGTAPGLLGLGLAVSGRGRRGGCSGWGLHVAVVAAHAAAHAARGCRGVRARAAGGRRGACTAARTQKAPWHPPVGCWGWAASRQESGRLRRAGRGRTGGDVAARPRAAPCGACVHGRAPPTCGLLHVLPDVHGGQRARRCASCPGPARGSSARHGWQLAVWWCCWWWWWC